MKELTLCMVCTRKCPSFCDMKLVDTVVMKELTLCVWCVQKGARHCVTCEVGGNCVWCVDKSALIV